MINSAVLEVNKRPEQVNNHAISIIDEKLQQERIDYLYEHLVLGEDRFACITDQMNIVRRFYEYCLTPSFKTSTKLPSFYEILTLVNEHNFEQMLEIISTNVWSSPNILDEIREGLEAGADEDDFTNAVEEAISDEIDAEFHNMSYYYGPRRLEDFVLETLIWHSLPTVLDDLCLTGTIYKHFDVVICDAQNIIVPSFQIEGFQDAIDSNLYEDFAAKMIAWPKPIDEVNLIPAFAGHKVG